MKYEVINPLIVGSFDSSFDAATPIDAAKKFWVSLTQDNKLITNNVPRFMFTMKGGNKDLHHFMVKEKFTGENKNVEMSIEEMTISIPKKTLASFNKQLKQKRETADKLVSQQGGSKKRYKDDDEKDKKDDSSSSSSDYHYMRDYMIFRDMNSPVLLWNYNTVLYQPLVTELFIPTFTFSSTPYMSFIFS